MIAQSIIYDLPDDLSGVEKEILQLSSLRCSTDFKAHKFSLNIFSSHKLLMYLF